VDAVASQVNAVLDDVPAQYPFAQTMSWSDLRNAIARGFSVGSHTVTHSNLAILPLEEARNEIASSKKTIEQQLAVECRHFCYPYGAHNDRVAAVTADSGYEASVTTHGPGRNKPGHNLFALNRYAAPAAPRKLAFVMSGFGDALRQAPGKRTITNPPRS
jgi:peptidoglycan/xylan/chitin deacetylase (PgdA/CDA1 family)